MPDVLAPQKEASWQIMDRATAQRKSLLAAGYTPIPVSGKVPIMPEWQKQQPTVSNVEKWPQLYPRAFNTGILTCTTPTVDIDVYDGDVVDELRELLWRVVGDGGNAIVRIGQAPKCAIPFQTNQPFAKCSTPVFTSPDGRKHHVEVLGDGQQVVVFGKHPETGANYTWHLGEPGKVMHDDLPHINSALAAEYIVECGNCMRQHGWVPEDKKNGKTLESPVVAGENFDKLYGGREQQYALAALSGCAIELARTEEGGRNEKLNKVSYHLGGMIARGWVDEKTVVDALLRACDANNYLREHGHRATMKTMESGFQAGRKEPHPDLPDRDPSSGGDGPANSDLSDLSGLSGIRGAKQGTSEEQLARGRRAETGTWEEPDRTLLDDRRGDLPDFPVVALPAALRDWLLRAARGAGVTPAHVAVPLLGIASSLIGTARRVRACRSWSEPLTMWVAVVGFSGTGKTPGLDVTRRVLSVIERSRKQKIAELQREHETRAQKAKAEKKKWEKAVAEAVDANLPAPPKPAGATEPGPFVAPRLCLSDGTIERIAVLLEARPQGLVFVADELARLFLNMQRYSNGQDNEFWLEAWNGKHFVVERQGRPPVVLDYLLVGVIGGFQPDKLARAFEGDDDGMYARFCFAWPEEPAHRPLSNEVSEIEPEIQNALTRLINLPSEEDGVFAPRTVDLSAEALAAFEAFRTFLDQLKPDLDGREREWAAKGGTHVLRLSGALAYLDWAMLGGPEPQSVGQQHVEAAVRLWREYFWPHSRAAVRQVGLTEKHANARRTLCWIRTNRKAEVSLQDIRQDALGRRLDAELTRSLLDGLVRAGWLKLVTKKTAGRAVHRWQVNPQLFPGASPLPESPERPERDLAP
jgi:Protein of unknown function (DUF3987)/Bifunctional DNA primase/polymerase, N-terminal